MESLDILVTDVMMPQMTGDELARRLRQNGTARFEGPLSDRFSATASSRRRSRCEADEAFLDKPCGVQGCCRRVTAALYGRLEVPIDVTSKDLPIQVRIAGSAAPAHRRSTVTYPRGVSSRGEGSRFSRSCTGTNAR
jgi:CheY-like chemotaxis protein